MTRTNASFQDEVRATFRRGDSAGVLRLARAEAERARAAGDAAGEVEALYALARVALRVGELDRAEQLARAALDVAVASGDEELEERPRHVLAAVARLSGDYPTARERYLASIDLNQRLGRPETVNSESYNLAFTELRLGNVDRARELFRVVRERTFREGYDSFVPYVCVAEAALASATGDHARAARMVGLSDSAYAALGQVPDPDDARELAAAQTAAVEAIGASRFAREYDVGAARTPAEALATGDGAAG